MLTAIFILLLLVGIVCLLKAPADARWIGQAILVAAFIVLVVLVLRVLGVNLGAAP